MSADGARRAGPAESVAGAPFWAATRERRLVLPTCASCGRPHWYPRGFCPHCLGTELSWPEVPGGGTVHAVSVQPKPARPDLADRVPVAVALVDLDAGVRMLMSVDAPDPWAVAVGDRIAVGWEPLEDGRHLPIARPG